MNFQIKNRWSGNLIFECELNTSFETKPYSLQLAAAIKTAFDADANLRDADLCDANLCGADLCDANLRGANLCGANLRDADLRDANLRDADLRDANLRDANLRDADLCDANLCGANLRGANLRDADLRDANLRGANLRGADLCGADLCGANLCGANLRDADLCDADLTPIRDDLWAVLSSAPREVDGLRKALISGGINGSTYSGDCACLVGTIANIRNADINNLGALKPNSRRPIERFFLGIGRGDTPETNQFSLLALRWTDEWLNNMKGTFGEAESTT